MSNEHCIDEAKAFTVQALADNTPYKNINRQGLNQTQTPFSQKDTLPNTLVKEFQFDQDTNCMISQFDSDNADIEDKSPKHTLQYLSKLDQGSDYSPNVGSFNTRNDSGDQEYSLHQIDVINLVSDYTNITQQTFAYPSQKHCNLLKNQSHQNSVIFENIFGRKQNYVQNSKFNYQQPIESKVSIQNNQLKGIDDLLEQLKNVEQIVVESVDNHNQMVQTKIEPSYLLIGSKKRVNPTQSVCSAENSCKAQSKNCNLILENPLSNAQDDVEIKPNQYPSNIGQKRTFPNMTLNDNCIEEQSNLNMIPCSQEGCSKSYTNKNGLDNHKRIKHNLGKPKYICEYDGCNKPYFDKTSYYNHCNSHEGRKNYACTQCDKRYTTNGHLKDHVKSFHDKIKNFECTFQDCTDKFARKSVLKVHMRKHDNDKPYKCDKCSKCFTESGNLKVHKQTHDKHIESIHILSQDDLKSLNISKEDIDTRICQLQSNKKQIQVSDQKQDQLSLQVQNLCKKVSLEQLEKRTKIQKKMQSKKQQNNENILRELQAIDPTRKENDIETQSNNNSLFENEQFLKRLKLE
ncbi:zinc finger protein 177-like isoform 2 [Stylonychia lemnae]|uniref:Zinc finger protein 177-like isoform 2 n=1 Tax=Stylonychia lemnae TaxID=5949 RepID=A0A078AB21_STYLE|nr:zinc finger protein 177-like isoform 2 [Stylonychia lemnae]|eukprot:CDW79071.1 zinc finger protein 177-like isoform 2 [Stylonychia lemnae]